MILKKIIYILFFHFFEIFPAFFTRVDVNSKVHFHKNSACAVFSNSSCRYLFNSKYTMHTVQFMLFRQDVKSNAVICIKHFRVQHVYFFLEDYSYKKRRLKIKSENVEKITSCFPLNLINVRQCIVDHTVMYVFASSTSFSVSSRFPPNAPRSRIILCLFVL